MGNVQSEIRSAVLAAFDAGNQAQTLTLPLATKPLPYRWVDFMNLFAIAKRSSQRTTATDLQSESAAFACKKFADTLQTLVELFPDSSLVRHSQPSRSWYQRTWHADIEAAAEIRAELAAVMTVIVALVSDLNRGREPQPR